MKFKKIFVAATIACLVVILSDAKATSTANKINLAQSNNFVNNYHSFIQPKKEEFKIYDSYFINSLLENQKLEICKINKRSMSTDWINLLAKLIILGSFGSVGVVSNSVVIERYIKLIFKDILPVFIIVYLLIILFGIVNVIASNSFSSAPSTYSISSQNPCIQK